MFVYQLIKWTSRSSSSEDEQMMKEEDMGVNEKVRSQFISACAYLPTVANMERVSKADQLYLYARYKQATCGKADKINRPGLFDVVGREKFSHWAQLGDMSVEEAMRQYVNKMMDMDVGWDPSRKCSAGFGLRPSTMADIDSSETESSGMSSEQLEWFCALNEGNIEKITDLLNANSSLLEERDENQLTALHWAADRGKLELVGLLIGAGADVNIQDYSGQTPLHYAVSCSHDTVVDFLLDRNADPTIADFEGNCPLDVVTDERIRRRLEGALRDASTSSTPAS